MILDILTGQGINPPNLQSITIFPTRRYSLYPPSALIEILFTGPIKLGPRRQQDSENRRRESTSRKVLKRMIV